ncbi:MAG: methionine adenosyltransferase [Candidatus Atabeyarchaeum deiterrae]
MPERNIMVESVMQTPVEKQHVELVERKGVGHPDSICDGFAEELSRKLCSLYKEKIGYVLHHNVDKLLLTGGVATPRFGGGEVTKPIIITTSGRATQEHDGVKFVMADIAKETLSEFIKRNFRYLKYPPHIQLDILTKPGSPDLTDLFIRYQRSKEIPGANDTSFGIGYAPHSELEKAVLGIEALVNSKEFKSRKTMYGEDVKVMGHRIADKLYFTMATPQISSLVPGPKQYLENKVKLVEEVKGFLKKTCKRDFQTQNNTADNENDPLSYYLTVTGTSAEMGDDGEVGRGNRVNGIISPNRPMSLEAAAGKNPVTHVGKIYNVLAFKTANRIYEEVGDDRIEEVYVRLLSAIGKAIDKPQVASAQMILRPGVRLESIRSNVESIIEDNLRNITKMTDEFIKGTLRVF